MPLLMSRLDREQALRRCRTLEAVVPVKYRGGSAALERIKNQYVGSDLPSGSYADQTLENLDGQLLMRFEIARPKDADNLEVALPNAATTELVAKTGGRTSVSFEVRDAAGSAFRIAPMDICVPMFVQVTEYAGPTYANHGPVVTDPHLLDTVLAGFHLSAQKADGLQTVRLVAESWASPQAWCSSRSLASRASGSG